MLVAQNNWSTCSASFLNTVTSTRQGSETGFVGGGGDTTVSEQPKDPSLFGKPSTYLGGRMRRGVKKDKPLSVTGGTIKDWFEDISVVDEETTI